MKNNKVEGLPSLGDFGGFADGQGAELLRERLGVDVRVQESVDGGAVVGVDVSKIGRLASGLVASDARRLAERLDVSAVNGTDMLRAIIEDALENEE